MSENRQSLVDPWQSHTRPLFFHRLGLLNPQQRWDMISQIQAAEATEGENAAFRDYLSDHYRSRLALSPINDGDDLDELAGRAADHAQRRNLHTTMLMGALASGQPLDNMVDLTSLEPVHSAVAEHGSAIVLPVHARAIEAGVFAMAQRVPTTLVVSQTAGIPDDPSVYDDLVGTNDLHVLRAPNPNVLIRCVKAAKSGRVLMLPPEFTSNENDLVTPYVVAGRQVGVPYAYVELARRLKLPLLPMLFEQQDDLTYRWRFDGPFDASDTVGDVPAAVHSVFAMVEEVLADDPAEWEGWYMFDRLIADGERLDLEDADAADSSALVSA